MIQGNDAPMTLRPGVQSLIAKSARHFATELLHEIITLTLSRYLSDVLIAPASTRSWDAIGTLLHVDYHFRSCTLSVLNALWDGNFVDHKTGHPRNYIHKIEYLRGLAELAQTNPKEVLPPVRHVLSMRPNTAPYERLGRFFIAYQAQVNKSLADDNCYHLYDNLSNLTLGFPALPKGLRVRMFGEFADYVVSNLLVWIRGKVSVFFLVSTFFY
ncbi:hypothetical protein F5888DRAFT_335648 [Russula emetica]|nr:hypothetical protein F5888DRAFT_335648 [Russula emetica]